MCPQLFCSHNSIEHLQNDCAAIPGKKVPRAP
jgi:hypothetical protein